ncbi:MAG: fibronectin type III domain-containing protein [Spirochaetales bacterium]|nr:fibronectin type III domain-containing protein [Spirochaetales bacterium]
MKKNLLITSILSILSIIFPLAPIFSQETQLFYTGVEYPDQGTIQSSGFTIDPAGTIEVPLNGYARLYLTGTQGYEPAGFYINGVFSEGGLYEYKVESIVDPITVTGSFRPVQDISSQAIQIISPYESGIVKTGADNTVTIVFINEIDKDWEQGYRYEIYKNGAFLEKECILDINKYLRRYENLPLDEGENVFMIRVNDIENYNVYSVDFVRVHYSASKITDANDAIVLIDDRLYNQSGIADKLSQYVVLASQRIGADFGISVFPVNGIDDWSTDQVKSYIAGLKDSYKALEGVLLVGNIKLPSFYKPGDDILQSRLFTHKYEDLDILLMNNNSAAADYDYMEKGVNPLPELWCAVMPVGYDGIPENNDYEDFALQLTPYLDKLLDHYNNWNDSYNFYQLSDRMWDLNSLCQQWGTGSIYFHSVNDTGLGPYQWCPEATPEMFYKPMDTWNMGFFSEMSDYYRRFPWIGEGWQSKDMYIQHMNDTGYSIVWTHSNSQENNSVITTEEAKTLTNGGTIQMVTGGSAGEFTQFGSASFTDTGIYPDGNILCGYVYGTSNCLTSMGCPFGSHHESHFENLSAFLAQGDYAGNAHFFRKCLQYHNSGSNPDSLKLNTQEILIGDPFVKIGYSYGEQDVTPPTIPQNLVCTDVTSSSIAIQWDAAVDDQEMGNYRIRATDTDSNTIDYYESGTAYVIFPLIPNMTYTIKVMAIDNYGNMSDWSSPITMTTLEGIHPTIPQNLICTGTTDRTISIQWEASSNESGTVEYRLNIITSAYYEEWYDTYLTANTSFTFEWLDLETTYTIRIQAYDPGTGNASPWSDSITVTTNKAIPPTTPQNLRVIDIIENSISLAWDPSTDDTGVAGYEVHYVDSNGSYFWGAGETGLIVYPLISNYSYTFRVHAYDTSFNYSSWSEKVTATTNSAIPPTVPQNLHTESITENSITLAWDPSIDEAGIYGYTINYTNPNGYMRSVWTQENYISISSLTPDSTYIFRVYATDKIGNKSDFSAPFSVTTNHGLPPTVPQNLAVSGVTETSISLTWDPSTDASGISRYDVRATENTGYEYIRTSYNTMYTFSNLDPNTEYNIAVMAIDSYGENSDWSLPINVTTLNTLRPAAPQNLVCTEKSDIRISLSWDPVVSEAGISAFQVSYTDPEGLENRIKRNVSSSLTIRVSPDTTYVIKVRAYDNNNISGLWSDPITVTTNPSIPPTVPQNLIVTNVTDVSVSLAWDPSTDDTGISGYQTFCTRPDGEIYAYWTSENHLTIHSLVPESTYIFRVQACDISGNYSDYSGPATVTTNPAIPPSIPRNLTVTELTDILITLEWDPSSDDTGVAGYYISFTRPDGEIDTYWSAENSITIMYLEPGSSYILKVQAYDISGNYSDYSDPLPVTTNPAVPPSIPQNLMVTAITDVSVSLAWNPSTDDTGISGYLITCTWPNLDESTYWTAENQITIKYLEPDYFYIFKVQSQDISGNYSAFSEPVNVTTITAIPPTVPQNFRITGITDVSVSLAWDPSTDDIGISYYYIRCSDPGENIYDTSTTDTFITLYLEPSTTYTFIVKAIDTSDNESDWSQPVAATTNPIIPPTVPQNLTIADVTESSISILWDPSTDDTGISSYLIFCTGEGESTHYYESTINQLTISALTPDVTYTIMVMAFDTSYNSSDWSDAISVTTFPAPPEWTPYPSSTPTIVPTPMDGNTMPPTPGITSFPGTPAPTPVPTAVSTDATSPAPTPTPITSTMTPIVEPTPELTIPPTSEPTPEITIKPTCEPTPAPTPKPHKTHHPHKTPGPMHTPKHEKADLCPLKISMTGTPKAGSEIILESGISNTGTKDSGRFRVKWVINGKTAAHSYYKNVPPGQTIQDEGTKFAWVPGRVGKYRISFIVDSDNNVHEWNNFNNVAFTTIFVKH